MFKKTGNVTVMAQQYKCLYKYNLHIIIIVYLQMLCSCGSSVQTGLWKLFMSGMQTYSLHLVAALSEVHLLPHHGAPHAEETPQVVEGASVEGVFVCSAVFEVGDAVA